MYCEYWKLKEPPFENVPDSRFVFYSANHDEALMRLLYTVKYRKGACLMTGAVGCGKTTISTVFMKKLKDDALAVALVTNPNLSSQELILDILYRLGRPQPSSAAKIDLIHALHEQLQTHYKEGRETVIIIDEAHLIKDAETYEELRLLLNYHQDNRFLLTLVLVGQPELKDSIQAIPQFEQRVPIKYHLKPLNFIEMCKYIQFRLKTAGSKRKIFTAEAVKKIFVYSSGIPRRINSICDMSLLAGYIDRRNEIDHLIIEKVIEDEG